MSLTRKQWTQARRLFVQLGKIQSDLTTMANQVEGPGVVDGTGRPFLTAAGHVEEAWRAFEAQATSDKPAPRRRGGRDDWRHEQAMEAGMLHGTQGYNDAMGY